MSDKKVIEFCRWIIKCRLYTNHRGQVWVHKSYKNLLKEFKNK